MNENTIITINDYNRVDGRNAYNSNIKKITLGDPKTYENKNMSIAIQIWKEKEKDELELSFELPIHQIIDLMIFLSRTILHFKEAYRLPLLYNPECPTIDRIGIQGDAISLSICTDNSEIDKDIFKFCQSLNDLGELTGERIRILTYILKELECY